MNSSTNASILLSFLSLYCAKFFSVDNQQIIGFVGISFLGIVHGANDIKILTAFSNRSKRLVKQVLLRYILTVGIGFVLFFFFPLVTLFSFVLISGFHFGNQHWSMLNQQSRLWAVYLFQTLYGLFVMCLLFMVHPAEVDHVIQYILNTAIPAIPYRTIALVLGILLVLAGLYIHSFFSHFKKFIAVNLFFLLLFTIIFLNSGLIWGFAIYFILWHSIPSMHDQVTFLYGSGTRNNWFTYCKSGFVFWLIPTLGILILYQFISDDLTFKALFFSIIAAVTFPHAYVISRMQAATTDQSNFEKE